jgi:uncharacterized protein
MYFSQFSQRWQQWVSHLGLTALSVLLVVQVCLGSAAPAGATSVFDLPALVPGESTWLHDEANILSRLTRSNLSGALDSLAKKTGNQVHLVTIHRLDYGETVDTFAQQLFERWFPTPEAQANQTLLVLDNVTNNVAIRTGEGVKLLLTDDIASSVAQETLMAPLREGDRYNQALIDANDRLVAVLSGQPDPGPPVIASNIQTESNFATPEETASSNATIWVIGLLVAATVIPMATYFLYQVMQS